MFLFAWLYGWSKGIFPRFCWGLLVPACVVSNFVFGFWPLICSKIGLVNKKSHLDLIRDIKGVIEERREKPSDFVTVDAASDESSEGDQN
jgi:hypothetical protein